MDLKISQDPEAGETTCAFAVVSKQKVFGASVDDSGVWVIGDAGFVNLTENQKRKPLIGSGSAWPISFARSVLHGERILLATDGLLKYASAERIVTVCRALDIESAASKLIDLVRYPSGALPDDTTVILASM